MVEGVSSRVLLLLLTIGNSSLSFFSMIRSYIFNGPFPFSRVGEIRTIRARLLNRVKEYTSLRGNGYGIGHSGVSGGYGVYWGRTNL